KGLICPAACGSEAALAGEDVDILAAPHLLSLVNHFKGHQLLTALSAADLVLPAPGEGSAEVRARVARARELQRARFIALGARTMRTNADCSGRILEEIATPDAEGVALL